MTVCDIEKQCKSVIRKHLPEERWKILLFGSQASGKASETSDIDIAIDGGEPVPWAVLATNKDEIKNIQTLRSIDIIDLHAGSEGFRREALRHAREL